MDGASARVSRPGGDGGAGGAGGGGSGCGARRRGVASRGAATGVLAFSLQDEHEDTTGHVPEQITTPVFVNGCVAAERTLL